MAVMIVASVLQMARETSSPVERGFKSEVGSVGRSVFSHAKISSHHIHRWWWWGGGGQIIFWSTE